MDVIFDFDGVLKDTNHFKIECFKESLMICHVDQESTEILIKRFKALFGATRDAILNDLSLEVPKVTAERIIRIYGEIVKNDYIKQADILSRDFLVYLKNKANLHVASGHPVTELKLLIEESDVFRSMFSTVNGSPSVKSEVLSRFSNSSNPVIFVGDSYQDYLSSKGNNSITFLWFRPYMVQNSSNKALSKIIPRDRTISSINQLYEYFSFSPH